MHYEIINNIPRLCMDCLFAAAIVSHLLRLSRANRDYGVIPYRWLTDAD